MKTGYISILDFSTGKVKIIHLTESENKRCMESDDPEEFLRTIQNKYRFSVNNSVWMGMDTPELQWYENGRKVKIGRIITPRHTNQ